MIITFLFFQIHVPTDEEMVTMLKRKHHMFEVLYGWCCAKAGLLTIMSHPLIGFQLSLSERSINIL